jgi:hypothetical protein
LRQPEPREGGTVRALAPSQSNRFVNQSVDSARRSIAALAPLPRGTCYAAQWLALGANVQLALDGTIYEITE